MAIKLLFFAALRDRVGQSERREVIPTEIRTIGELRRWLEGRIPQLDGRLESVRFAVNEQFVGDEHALVEDDAVALIPPVAGG
jgi:molybdopterin converting factor subunit 1